MKNLSNKIKLILSSVLLAVFAAVTVAAVLLICNDAAHSVPNGVKLIMFLCGAVGCFLFFCFTINFAVLYSKEKTKDKQLIAAGLMQNPAEDVTRKPVKYDDEKGFNELEEHTNKFFENIVYPQGFLEFLKRFDNCNMEKCGGLKKVFIYGDSSNRSVTWGNYCELCDVYKFEDLIKINKDMLLYADDYYTQFRNILLFADDESGHCQFLLDYGKGGEPSVKYMDNELDIIIHLADTFAEFEQKLLSASEAKEILKDEYYGFE